MTATQHTNIASRPQRHIFWLATWHNLPIPLGELGCCRITPAMLEIDISPATHWSIPISRVLQCTQHVHHDSVNGLYLYACLTIEQTQPTTHEDAVYEIYLGALDPIGQNWDWEETMNLITVINALIRRQASPVHPNPYYRAFARHERLAAFAQLTDEWDPLASPQTYSNHPLIKDVRNQAANAIGAPFLSILLSIGIGVTIVFFWRGTTWALIEVGLGICGVFGLLGFYYRKAQRSSQQLKYYLAREQATPKHAE